MSGKRHYGCRHKIDHQRSQGKFGVGLQQTIGIQKCLCIMENGKNHKQRRQSKMHAPKRL